MAPSTASRATGPPDADGSTRSLLFLSARAGCGPKIVEAFERHEIAGKAIASGGCREVELLVDADSRDELIVTALWSDGSDYERWLQSDVRATANEELGPLLAGPPVIRISRVLASQADPGTR